MSVNRVRFVLLNAALVSRIFDPKPMHSLDSDWPSDAQIVNAFWDDDHRVMQLLVHSATFDEVPELNIVPQWNPTFVVHSLAADLIDLIESFRDARATP